MISVRNLTKIYEDKVAAVKDLSFELGKGEIVAILGPSGCGKTTALRCIAGFEQPNTGEIYIDGNLVSSGEKGIITPVESRGLGFVHQNYALWPHRTVFKNIAYPLELRKFPQQQIKDKVQEILQLVRLENYSKRYPAELSGGEQQRVALARSLAYGPNAILLDEPLSNLDAKLREQTRFELRRLFKELNISALYVTHDQNEAMAISDRCMVMKKGEIQQIGEPVNLYINPESAFVADFMGSSNIIVGGMCASGENRVDLECGSFQFSGEAAFDEDDKGMLCIRPKDIVMDPDVSHHENAFQAKVMVKTFAGDYFKFLVTPLENPSMEILVHVYDYEKATKVQEGNIINVWFPQNCCRLIPS